MCIFCWATLVFFGSTLVGTKVIEIMNMSRYAQTKAPGLLVSIVNWGPTQWRVHTSPGAPGGYLVICDIGGMSWG